MFKKITNTKTQSYITFQCSWSKYYVMQKPTHTISVFEYTLLVQLKYLHLMNMQQLFYNKILVKIKQKVNTLATKSKEQSQEQSDTPKSQCSIKMVLVIDEH